MTAHIDGPKETLAGAFGSASTQGFGKTEMEPEYVRSIVDVTKVHGFVRRALLTIPPDLSGRQMNYLHRADSSACNSYRSSHRPNNSHAQFQRDFVDLTLDRREGRIIVKSLKVLFIFVVAARLPFSSFGHSVAFPQRLDISESRHSNNLCQNVDFI